jgi:hypothetical protein
MSKLKKPKKLVIPPLPIPNAASKESATARALRKKLEARLKKI